MTNKRNLLLISILIVVAPQLMFPQSHIKVWTETSVQDFSDGQLENLVVANSGGGEVQFPFPLLETVPDFLDNNALRYISQDSTGDFVRTWIQGGNVFVRKYAADRSPLTDAVVANDSANIAGPDERSNIALFDDGTFLVVWNAAQMTGQVFTGVCAKVGPNFTFNDTANFSNNMPTVLANRSDQTFWLFYSLLTPGGYRIHVQRRDKQGNKIGETSLLNQPAITKWEGDMSVVQDGEGFIVSWVGADGISSDYVDIYLRRYHSDGSSAGPIIKVNDDQGLNGQAMPALCEDPGRNLLVVWMDQRLNSQNFNMYGQMYNSAGLAVGRNLRMESSPAAYNYEPQIVYADSEFQVSWRAYIDLNFQTYVNRWKYDAKTSGTFRSHIHDTGPGGASYQTIAWTDSSVLPSAIRFRLRTGNTVQELTQSSWYGPADTTGFYTNKSGEGINPIHSGQRYIQYQAYFHAPDASLTILRSISIQYTPADTVAPLAPTGVVVSPAHASIKVTWDANQEPDLAGYRVYRDTVGGGHQIGWLNVVQTSARDYVDSTATVGITYYYAVAAYDSSDNESEYSIPTPASAFAGSIYVSAGAPPGGDGSIGSPFNSIQGAIAAAVHEDTVRVLPGVYNEYVTMVNGVSLVGVAADQCIIQGSLKAADRCAIQGLTINRILNCTSVSPVIRGNIIRNSGGPFYSAALEVSQSASPIIENNFISECQLGIHVFYQCRPVITNNIILANDCGISIWAMENVTIRNNTIVANRYGAITMLSDTAVIENNILYTRDSSAIADIPAGPARHIRYNDFWNPIGFPVDSLSGNIFANPLFMSLPTQDFRLSGSSPCINAGDPDPRYFDRDGSRNDMGAYGGPEPFEGELTAQLVRSIAVSSASAYPGDTISVFLHIDNAAGLASAAMTLRFSDSLLSVVRVRHTSTTENWSLVTEQLSPREIGITVAGTTGLPSGGQDLAEVQFSVASHATTGDASPLSLEGVILRDLNLRGIILRSIADGVIVVSDYGESPHFIYVDSRNEGLQDGTRRYPFRTIMDAMHTARGRDTILVAGGAYSEAVTVKDSVSVIGAGAAVSSVVVTGDQTAFLCTNMHSGEISGFTIKAGEGHISIGSLVVCDSASPVIKSNRFESVFPQTYGILCVRGSRPLIEQNYMKALCVSSNSSSPDIRRNVIEGPLQDGVASTGGMPIISDNKFVGDILVAIRVGGGTIRNNLILSSLGGCTGIAVDGSTHAGIVNNIIVDRAGGQTGISIRNSSDITISNNTILTRGRGITDQLSASVIMNNIVTGNAEFGLQASTGSLYDYNDIWNNAQGYLEINPGPHDFSKDPIFVDTSANDFRLSAGSPCINAGNPDAAYNDRDGSRADVGAFGGPYADSTWMPSSGSSIAIDSLTVSSTDTVQVRVSGGHTRGIAGISFTLSCNPSALEIIDASTTGLTKGFSLERTVLSPGSVKLTLSSNRGLVDDEGDLLRLRCVAVAKDSSVAYIRFDSVRVLDEVSCSRTVAILRDGKIVIVPLGAGDDHRPLIPQAYELCQNYPNPFNPLTTIRYGLPRRSYVTLTVFNVLGQEIRTLVDEGQQAGYHEVRFQGANLASGVYFYRIRARPLDGGGEFSVTRKLLLLK